MLFLIGRDEKELYVGDANWLPRLISLPGLFLYHCFGLGFPWGQRSTPLFVCNPYPWWHARDHSCHSRRWQEEQSWQYELMAQAQCFFTNSSCDCCLETGNCGTLFLASGILWPCDCSLCSWSTLFPWHWASFAQMCLFVPCQLPGDLLPPPFCQTASWHLVYLMVFQFHHGRREYILISINVLLTVVLWALVQKSSKQIQGKTLFSSNHMPMVVLILDWW